MTKLPEAFVKRIKEELKEEATGLLDSFNEAPVMSLRLNPLKEVVDITKFLPSAAEEVPWEKNGRYYSAEDAPGKHPLHAAGAYYIQEASAMLPAAMLMKEPLRENERILDLCSAPGGKATQIAGYMRGRGLLVCNEFVPARAKILSENIERMGIVNAIVTNHDPAFLSGRFAGFFTRILVDAPCSGEGMFRKHPEAANEWSEEAVEMCAKRQDEILDRAAEMLMSGGLLVYSTCTWSKAEDEECVARFLARHEDFGMVDITQNPVKLLPHKVRGEGHFAVLLKKKGELPDQIFGVTDKKGFVKPSREEMKLFEEFVADNINEHYVNIGADYALFGKNLYALPPQYPSLSSLKVLRCGLQLGSFEKKRFVPSHAWALALSTDEVKRSMELDEKMANDYLRGMTLGCDTARKGWILLTFGGVSLGWGKASGGIVKNHYPRGLRLF